MFSVYLAKYRSSASRLLPLPPLLLRLLQLLKARHVSDSCRRSIDKHSGPCARSTFVAALRVSAQHNSLPLTHSLCCPCHSFPTHVNVQLSEPSRQETNNSFEMRVICAFATSLAVGHPNAEKFNHSTFHVDIYIFLFLSIHLRFVESTQHSGRRPTATSVVLYFLLTSSTRDDVPLLCIRHTRARSLHPSRDQSRADKFRLEFL